MVPVLPVEPRKRAIEEHGKGRQVAYQPRMEQIQVGSKTITINRDRTIVEVCRAYKRGEVSWDDLVTFADTYVYHATDMQAAKTRDGTIMGSAWEESASNENGDSPDEWSVARTIDLLTEDEWNAIEDVLDDRMRREMAARRES